MAGYWYSIQPAGGWKHSSRLSTICWKRTNPLMSSKFGKSGHGYNRENCILDIYTCLSAKFHQATINVRAASDLWSFLRSMDFRRKMGKKWSRSHQCPVVVVHVVGKILIQHHQCGQHLIYKFSLAQRISGKLITLFRRLFLHKTDKTLKMVGIKSFNAFPVLPDRITGHMNNTYYGVLCDIFGTCSPPGTPTGLLRQSPLQYPKEAIVGEDLCSTSFHDYFLSWMMMSA